MAIDNKLNKPLTYHYKINNIYIYIYIYFIYEVSKLPHKKLKNYNILIWYFNLVFIGKYSIGNSFLLMEVYYCTLIESYYFGYFETLPVWKL
jgi:hypothetical protein